MMPTYVYECLCGKVTEEARTIAERNAPAKCECGGWAQRGIETPKGFSDMEPYFDENLAPRGGTGTWVGSKRERRELMRRHGLTEAYGKGWM